MSPVDRLLTVSRSLGRGLLERRAAPGGTVLAYHDVVLAEPAENPLVVSAERLRTHVVTMRQLGLEIVSIDEFVGDLRDGRSVDTKAVLTFDDALAGVYDHAAPVLAEMQAPATVFVVADAVAGPPPWWKASGPVMSEDQLHHLHADGWTIAGHSASHASLPSLNTDELLREVAGCRDALRRRGFGEVDHFAYPSGHFDQGVVEALRSAGFASGFTFLNGRVTQDLDRFRLPRLTMGVHSSAARLAYHLLREAESWPDHQLASSGAATAVGADAASTTRSDVPAGDGSSVAH